MGWWTKGSLNNNFDLRAPGSGHRSTPAEASSDFISRERLRVGRGPTPRCSGQRLRCWGNWRLGLANVVWRVSRPAPAAAAELNSWANPLLHVGQALSKNHLLMGDLSRWLMSIRSAKCRIEKGC